jgi:hypothetical protein
LTWKDHPQEHLPAALLQHQQGQLLSSRLSNNHQLMVPHLHPSSLELQSNSRLEGQHQREQRQAVHLLLVLLLLLLRAGLMQTGYCQRPSSCAPLARRLGIRWGWGWVHVQGHCDHQE